MEFYEVVGSRHSVREYRSGAVSREILERIIDSATHAPSAENEQPCRFYVTSGSVRAELGKVIAQTTVYLAEYIDVLGPDHYERAVHWFSSFGDAPVLLAIAVPKSATELQATNRAISVGTALENLLLAATAEGLGACPFTFSHWVKDEMAELLGVPEGHEILMVVAVGWPADIPAVAPSKRDDVSVWLD